MSGAVAIGADRAHYAHVAYSPAIRVGNMVFVSGQVAIDESGQALAVGDFCAQGELVFQRLAEILDQAGSSMKEVVKVTIFLKNSNDFPEIVRLRKRWFSEPYPADSTVIVQSLVNEECLLEIEAIAFSREEDSLGVT